MAKIVRIESHKDWKGTKIKKDWSKEPHHKHCCCNKCAPTREDLHRKVKAFNIEKGRPEHMGLHIEYQDETYQREYTESENLAPSDCEP